MIELFDLLYASAFDVKNDLHIIILSQAVGLIITIILLYIMEYCSSVDAEYRRCHHRTSVKGKVAVTIYCISFILLWIFAYWSVALILIIYTVASDTDSSDTVSLDQLLLANIPLVWCLTPFIGQVISFDSQTQLIISISKYALLISGTTALAFTVNDLVRRENSASDIRRHIMNYGGLFKTEEREYFGSTLIFHTLIIFFKKLVPSFIMTVFILGFLIGVWLPIVNSIKTLS